MAIYAKKTTVTMPLMGAEAVQKITQIRDVKAVTHKNLLTIEFDDSRTSTKNWKQWVITHVNVYMSHPGTVENESTLGRDNVVGSTWINHKKGGVRQI